MTGCSWAGCEDPGDPVELTLSTGGTVRAALCPGHLSLALQCWKASLS